tara:strand:- start:410 stop:883 length:474 start_codon:yes stop_codon:yes gene_type:complete
MNAATVHEITETKDSVKHTISLVPMDHCSTIWNQVRVHFVESIERSNGRWSMEHLLAALVSGQYQLWIAYDEEKTINGVLATQVIQYPCRSNLAMHFCGGVDFDNWYVDLLAEISKFAKESNCSALEGVARKGFWKWFKEDGFSKETPFYEKELNDG